MGKVAPTAIAINNVLDDVMRHDKGRLLSALIARLGDFQLAEDALQEAVISALKHWGRSGLPDSPTAWLMKVALRKSIDRIRKDAGEKRKTDAFEILSDSKSIEADIEVIPDERLRLIFTCCHPALEEKSRVALTLRTICGLTTREIAAVFLDNETTMGQRITRAKAKIASKGIAYSVPDADLWAERLGSVLKTVYLIFTTGYIAASQESRDLCKEGLFLMRLINDLKSHDPEIEGALALMLLTHARLAARVDEDGASVPITDQDQSRWDQSAIEEGQQLIARAMARRASGPFQIKAAIADCHMQFNGPDWQQIALLYKSLWVFEPTPVIALNWAVVVSELGQYEAALKRLDELADELSSFQPWFATRASVLRKLGRIDEAREAYKKAILEAPTQSDKRFLENMLAKL